MKLVLLALFAALAGCSTTFGGPDRDVTVTIPAVEIGVRPEYANRTHLRRHWVERGTRYCEYSDGKVFQRHYRYECPYTY